MKVTRVVEPTIVIEVSEDVAAKLKGLIMLAHWERNPDLEALYDELGDAGVDDHDAHIDLQREIVTFNSEEE